MKLLVIIMAFALSAQAWGKNEVSVILVHLEGLNLMKAIKTSLPLIQAAGGPSKLSYKVIQIDDAPLAQKNVVEISSPNLSKPIIVAGNGNDAYEGILVVATLENKFKIDKMILASTCGLLSDSYNVLDIMIPSHFLRSDYTYADTDGKTLLFPNWPVGKLKESFEASYDLDLHASPLIKKFESVSKSEPWKKAIAACLKKSTSPGAQDKTSLQMAFNTYHITGAEFVAGIPARKKLADAFKAQSVDMRAQQVLQAAKVYGTDVAADLSCSDLAGSDHPENAFEVFRQNFLTAHEVALITAIFALASTN